MNQPDSEEETFYSLSFDSIPTFEKDKKSLLLKIFRS
jgi:hypothetical protein